MSKGIGQFGLGTLERFATSFRADFRFGPINIMILLMFSLAGMAAHLTVYAFDLQVVISVLAAALILAVLLRTCQIWETALIFIPLAGLGLYLRHRFTAHQK